MNVDMHGWMALHSAMQGEPPRKAFTKAILLRVWQFARPYRRALTSFLLVSVVAAILSVATPLLAGQVVDEIVNDGAGGTVVRLALFIALIAVLDAVVGIVGRWQSAKIGEGLIFDLRRAVFGHVQRMPVAFFTRTRTGALVSRLDNDVIGAQRAFTWTLSGVVSNLITLLLTLVVMLRPVAAHHGAGPGPAPGVRHPRPPHGRQAGRPAAGGVRPQRGHDHPDDRAVLRPRRHAGEALRPPGRRGRRVRRPGRRGCATSACARRWPSGSSSPPSALVSSLGPRPRLRPRRLAGR